MSAPYDVFHRIAAADSIPTPGEDLWKLRCPECGGSAFSAGSDLLCPREGRRIPGESGILNLLREEKLRAFDAFLSAYRIVRRSEGWGGAVDYYRGLPFDSDGRHRDVWKIRARSYRAALRAIHRRFRNAKKADEWDRVALRILELGAGNGWFSWRMAERGHFVLATDIAVDDEDGLGALSRYTRHLDGFHFRLTRARAEMEELPLDDRQFDLVVANGSLHYARDPSRAAAEAFRVLRERGLFLVLDSPVYRDPAAGREMVRRREREHRERFGISSNEPTAGFLLRDEFVVMLQGRGFLVAVHEPFEGISRRMRRAYCAARGAPPPARFLVFVAEKPG